MLKITDFVIFSSQNLGVYKRYKHPQLFTVFELL
jgi:hypothetical protein